VGKKKKAVQPKFVLIIAKWLEICFIYFYTTHKTIRNSKMMNTIYLLVFFDPGIMTFNALADWDT